MASRIVLNTISYHGHDITVYILYYVLYICKKHGVKFHFASGDTFVYYNDKVNLYSLRHVKIKQKCVKRHLKK